MKFESYYSAASCLANEFAATLRWATKLRPIISTSSMHRNGAFPPEKGAESPIHRALLRSTGTSCPCGRRLRSNALLPDYFLKVHNPASTLHLHEEFMTQPIK